MPLIATRGAASAQGFGEFAQSAANYIEDVFSTYLYLGTGTTLSSTQTINNGIDLSTKGGMTWIKDRGTKDHFLFDTNRGIWKYLRSNTTDSEPGVNENALSAFNSNGFTVTGNNNVNQNFATNNPQGNYASWTFRKQAKFFDVVTYTGNGVSGRNITHSLSSTPGCIIIKCSSSNGSGWGEPANWWVFHRGLSSPSNFMLRLNTTGAEVNAGGLVANASTFTVYGTTTGSSCPNNVNGETYVAYLFAHNAGGFGAAGTDNVISCGSFTTNASGIGQTVNLGYEPQWILFKNSTGVGDWRVVDTMRGFTVNIGQSAELKPNLSSADSVTSNGCLVSNGFRVEDAASSTYIYIAIRRGPMKTPTSGTSVFSPITANATAGTVQTTGFVVDSQWKAKRTTDTLNTSIDDRLRGVSTTNTGSGRYLITSSNSTAEATTSETTRFFNNTGFLIPAYYASTSTIFYSFGRAPGFFDVVCYTGTGVARTVSHNLKVVPELMIVRERSGASSWAVYNSAGGNTSSLFLDSTNTYSTAVTYWNSTTPTSSVFSLAGGNPVNGNAGTYVAYLFATCPGVSKVGSYTGSGTTKQIDCGFTGGARFVLIKRTDSTGDWYVWDSARGIVAGNDPYLLLNSTAAEVTNTDYVDTYSLGFEISSTAPAAINANGGTFIFLAIA